MARKVMTSPERLSKDITKVLNDYQSGILVGMDSVMKALGNKGRNAVRREARSQIVPSRRKYANGWQYKMVGNRWAAGVVIYPGRQPAMAHLLEHGHALQGGGRTRPRPHIIPVQDQLEKEVVGEVSRLL